MGYHTNTLLKSNTETEKVTVLTRFYALKTNKKTK